MPALQGHVYATAINDVSEYGDLRRSPIRQQRSTSHSDLESLRSRMTRVTRVDGGNSFVCDLLADAPDGGECHSVSRAGGNDFVDVCPLCAELAWSTAVCARARRRRLVVPGAETAHRQLVSPARSQPTQTGGRRAVPTDPASPLRPRSVEVRRGLSLQLLSVPSHVLVSSSLLVTPTSRCSFSSLLINS